MAIKGVDTKCYILALFVRDDGERFLLGSGHYEFKDTQMHFAANAIQNDIVEVQGNDGFLLAGQVRRPGTQSFDGYVGDGTMSKEETESYRRQFFSFFRKNFFYKVIYVFSDGTAIQRKSGFLVDDPTVEELYQMYPEYHVALNFEDVNYYSYSEDEEGQEQYAKEATIDTSSMRATGGLVWDNLGVVWEATQWGGEQTASGTEMTIQNEMDVPSIVDDIRLDGDTYQQTYSGKNLFNVNGTSGAFRANKTISDQAITSTATTTGTGYVAIVIPNSDNLLGKECSISFSAQASIGIARFRIAEVASTNPSSVGSVMKTIVGNGSKTETVTFPTSYGTGKDCFVVLLYPHTDDSTWSVGDYATFTNIQLEVGSTATPYEPYTGGIPAPNPDYPQDVQTVTGEQTVTVSGDGEASQSYTINLGSLELCKIGDYQDKIFNNDPNEDWYDPELEDNEWYVHKATARVDVSSLGGWFASGSYAYKTRNGMSDILPASSDTATAVGLCNAFSASTTNLVYAGSVDYGFALPGAGGVGILIRNKNVDSLADFTTYLSNNPVYGYFALATPTDTKITDDTLIGQLNALGAMRLFIGENNLLVQATGTNLPAPLTFKYYTTVAMTGAEWEEGGSGGATVVEVDSITNTYPIWRVKGPAVDPQLSVINTNTTIRYTGTVTSTQTLEIDMFNKTAKLNGVSVIGNVSGDWVSLAPGTNRVIYTAENADAQPSTIEWQEVVG